MPRFNNCFSGGRGNGTGNGMGSYGMRLSDGSCQGQGLGQGNHMRQSASASGTGFFNRFLTGWNSTIDSASIIRDGRVHYARRSQPTRASRPFLFALFTDKSGRINNRVPAASGVEELLSAIKSLQQQIDELKNQSGK